MPTTFKKLCITALLFSIMISSHIVASPIEEKNALTSSSSETIAGSEILSKISEANQVSSQSATSADTLSFICDELTFTTSVGGGSDCWGWVDGNGVEYAIYATRSSIEFYNLETASLVASVPAPTSTWHDIKTYQHYCYSVSESTGPNDGLSIIDMQYLPDSVHFVDNVVINNSGFNDRTSHNLNIDTVQGYAYVEGTADIDNSVHILSLANPESPTYINSFGPSGGLHDMFCHNDTLYLAEGWNPSFSIWNMANKNFPLRIAHVTIPNSGYVHNIWPTGDKRHILTTEETPDKTIKLWNIEDLSNIQLTDEYLAPSLLAHNAHIVGDTAYISHYESGVVMLDLSDPNNIVEIAKFDTYPASENFDFNGCWGVYPHTPSGRFYASNMEGQLFILKHFITAINDTIIAQSAQGLPGSSVRVDIWANFSLPVHQFEIPFNWDGPLNLDYDSVSTSGLITEYFEVQQLSVWDGFFKRAVYLLRTSNSSSSPDLPAGEGVILSLYFTIPLESTSGENPITFTPFSNREVYFKNNCITYFPDTLSGMVSVGDPSCCVGFRGNIDGSAETPPTSNGIDIGDLISLVSYMFEEGPPPACDLEADVNGSGGMNPVDIGDVIALVQYMFQNGVEPAACP